MSSADKPELTTRTLVAIYVGGVLGVGLLTGAAYAFLSTTGWGDTSPSVPASFAIGFVVGTLSTVASAYLSRRRRRHQERRRG